LSELGDNVAAAFQLCNEQRERIAALEARLAALTSLCREYIDALDSGYDVLASHATDKIREAINPPQQEREP
jgi:hypothetical protein